MTIWLFGGNVNSGVHLILSLGLPIPISNSGIPKLNFNTDSDIQTQSIPIFQRA